MRENLYGLEWQQLIHCAGGTATRYLSGAQANVNVELALSQKKTLDLCL